MEEKTDQAKEEVKTDQTSKEQSENDDSKKTYTLEEAVNIAKNTQKGISQLIGQYNERIEGLEARLEEMANKANEKTGAESGDEEYLTVGKLKSILAEQVSSQSQAEEQRKVQADQYIETTLAKLRVDGVIAAKADEDELMNFAIKIKEPNLAKAALVWQEVKSAKEEAKKEGVKKGVRQEEGSKVGTSSIAGEGESKGIDYKRIANSRGWDDYQNL